MSYTIDIYRGKQKPQRHFGKFALYVSFFPQLVAGPIERSTNLLPQFDKIHNFSWNNITEGLKLMMWGFFKKLVIADNLAIVVNNIYNNSHDFTGVHYMVATVFFAYQIYADFSGYSDIAIGGARVMGYSLMKNFDRPYASKSVSEFWKRWHISLSSWFKDYFYISLGGNRVVKWRWYFNLFLTFLVSGLWHGANWTFIIWGVLNFFYLFFSIISQNYRDKFSKMIGLNRLPHLHNFIKTNIVFLLICFAWIFFRSNNISDSLYIIKEINHSLIEWAAKIFNLIILDKYSVFWNHNFPFRIIVHFINKLGVTVYEFGSMIFFIIILEAVQVMQKKKSFGAGNKYPKLLRWSGYYFILFLIIVFGKYNQQEFIYFQF
jgi:D-alanyl-lipoteichoic acid acyltransferase DltB (MBOAT superfamily)